MESSRTSEFGTSQIKTTPSTVFECFRLRKQQQAKLMGESDGTITKLNSSMRGNGK